LRTNSEVYLGAYSECTWERLESLLESVSQAGRECAIESNWERTVKQAGSVPWRAIGSEVQQAGRVLSRAIGSVLQSMPGSVLENALGGVLGSVLGVYFGAP
jgi:hypothetical protein